MSRYVLAREGAVITYPYSFVQLCRENPDISFPKDMVDSALAGFDVYPVETTEHPPVPLDKNLAENDPTLIGGVWKQTWVLDDATPEQIAERTEHAEQSQEFDDAKLDAWIIQFLAMSPTDAQNYVNANSATLAALRTNVARLAYAVRVLVRREFNK